MIPESSNGPRVKLWSQWNIFYTFPFIAGSHLLPPSPPCLSPAKLKRIKSSHRVTGERKPVYNRDHSSWICLKELSECIHWVGPDKRTLSSLGYSSSGLLSWCLVFPRYWTSCEGTEVNRTAPPPPPFCRNLKKCLQYYIFVNREKIGLTQVYGADEGWWKRRSHI